MRIRVAVPDEHVTPDVIDPVLEAVTRVNEHLIASGQTPTATELVKLGAIWRPENMGDEHFDHGKSIAERGWGDCDDWAPLKAAELRATGEDPDAVARVVPSGPNTFHAIVHSHGRDLLGPEDISVQAGMKGRMAEHTSVSGVCDGIDVWACDPHDGRIYQGQLAPSVGPLSIHCGPGMAVRGCTIHGPAGPVHLFEARVDMPISGSRLVHVRSYNRHRPRRVHGAMLPAALSVTHMAPTVHDAINGALVGAILAHQSDHPVDVDRYKLMALQGAMSGLSPGDVRARLAQAIHEDLHEAAAMTGHDPATHLHNLRAQAGLVHVVGWDPPAHRRRPWRDEDIDRRRYVAGGNTLGTNQALQPGQSITNNPGTARLTMQTDGNLVITNTKTGQPLWTSGTAGRGHHAWMEWTGNFRVEDVHNTHLWNNGASGHKDAFLRLEDDGNAVVWDGSNHQIWDAGASLTRPNATPGGSGHSHTDFGGLDSTLHQVEDVASSIVSDVSKVVNMVPWGEILHDVQAVVSVIPGLGTAVSEVLAAAESAIDFLKDGPLIGGLKAAYNFAMGAVPGAAAIRPILDPVVNTLIGIATSKQPVESQILDTILANVPDSPGFGPITPRSVVSTLAHFLISHLGVKKTAGYVPKSKPSPAAPPHPALAAPPKPKPAPPPVMHIPPGHPMAPAKPPPPKVVPLKPIAKPPAVAHAAMPVHPSIPPHPTAAPAPSLATPAGAAKTTWHCAPLPNGHWACAWQ
ncbi:MAG: hypothetical protein KGK07_13615 [Chloroflexota bacterium]|nr:hypothetical protein [Chloroflexota bacterium]